jgi:hypothetical protein
MADPDAYMMCGDTDPPLRGFAAADGRALPLQLAESMRVLMKHRDGGVIEIRAVALDPPELVDEEDPDGDVVNWSATPEAGDVFLAGDYRLQLEITWEEGRVRTVPNDRYLLVRVLEQNDPVVAP